MENKRDDNVQEQSKGKRSRKESLLLIIVALVGLGGILILQFSRRDGLSDTADRALVQGAGQSEEETQQDETTATIQRIPGNLIRENEQPEAGRPFIFEMANYSKGAEYILDLGDGSRKTFEEGIIRHTYYDPGAYTVTLFARYEGQEIELQKVTKQVANEVVDSEITPIIDF